MRASSVNGGEQQAGLGEAGVSNLEAFRLNINILIFETYMQGRVLFGVFTCSCEINSEPRNQI